MTRKASRTPTGVSVTVHATETQVHLSAEQLAAATGIRPTVLARLVRLAAVEPATPDGFEFTAATAARLKRMLRLRADLGVNFFASAIILDLLERLERLEVELDRTRGSR